MKLPTHIFMVYPDSRKKHIIEVEYHADGASDNEVVDFANWIYEGNLVSVNRVVWAQELIKIYKT